MKLLGSTKNKITKKKKWLKCVSLGLLKTFNSEFWYIEAWFTDQNSKPWEIKDKINITLVIN